MTLYRDIFAKALSLSWKHKLLWGLAFFAALPGNGGAFDFFFRGYDSLSGQVALLETMHQLKLQHALASGFHNVLNKLVQSPLLSIALILLFLAVLAMVLWVTITAQAGLITGVAQLMNGERITFMHSFSTGMQKFRAVFLANLGAFVLRIAPYLLLALPAAALYIAQGMQWQFESFVIIVYIVLIPLSALLLFLVVYSVCYIMLQGKSAKEAFIGGWQLFRRHWLTSLEVALVLYVVNVVISTTVFYGLALLGMGTTIPGLILLYVIRTVVGVFLASFQYAAWVVLFQALETGDVRSKILRVTDGWQQGQREMGSTTTPQTK